MDAVSTNQEPEELNLGPPQLAFFFLHFKTSVLETLQDLSQMGRKLCLGLPCNEEVIEIRNDAREVLQDIFHEVLKEAWGHTDTKL